LQPRIRGPADFRPGGCGCNSRLSPADEPAPYLNSGPDKILAQPIYPTNKYLDVTLTSIFQSTRASSQPPHTGRRQPAGCKLQPPAPSPNQTPSRWPRQQAVGAQPSCPQLAACAYTSRLDQSPSPFLATSVLPTGCFIRCRRLATGYRDCDL